MTQFVAMPNNMVWLGIEFLLTKRTLQDLEEQASSRLNYVQYM